MYQIYLYPQKIEDFYRYHERELEDEQVLIAEDDFYDIYLTSDAGTPFLLVDMNDSPKERMHVDELRNCEAAYREILRRNLNWPAIELRTEEEEDGDEGEVEDESDPEPDFDLDAAQELIDDREADLLDAFMDFVNVVYDPVGGVADENADFDSCMDMCLEWMSEFLGAVYRPVKVEEMGKSYVDYFPYESAKA